MVLTINRIKYLFEQDRIGREKRGSHDYLTVGELKVRVEVRESVRALKTNPKTPPFHRKHPEKA